MRFCYHAEDYIFEDGDYLIIKITERNPISEIVARYEHLDQALQFASEENELLGLTAEDVRTIVASTLQELGE